MTLIEIYNTELIGASFLQLYTLNVPSLVGWGHDDQKDCQENTWSPW